MNSFVSNNLFKIVTVLILLGIGGAIAYQSLAPKSEAGSFKRGKLAPDFQLENVDGKTMSLKDTEDKVRLVYFFFSSCPDVCTPTTFYLSKVQDLLAAKGELGKSTALISISFDPLRDTREVLKAFSAKFHADPAGWHFLRGEEAATKELANKYSLAVERTNDGNFAHTNSIVLVDRMGFIRQYYNVSDLELTPEKIANDMLELKKETK